MRQPPVFHNGEAIRAKLSLTTNGQLGFTAWPDSPRAAFPEIMVWEPKEGAFDPFYAAMRVGSVLGDGWSDDRNREIDVNEWVEFRRPGRYLLHAVVRHIVPLQRNATNSKPWLNCELKSNTEAVEILPAAAR